MQSVECRRANRLVVATAIAFPVAYFAAALILKLLPPAPGLRITLVMLPLAAFAAFIFAEVRLVRLLDEFQRHVQLEALAVAYPTVILLVFTLGLLEHAGIVVPAFERLRDVWLLTTLPYFIGLYVARRR